MARARKARRTVPWYVTIGIFFVAVLAITQFGELLERKLFYPWSDESGGRPALIGTWVGRTRTGRGERWGVLLDLERYRSSSGRPCGRCNNVVGEARTCDERGLVRRYRIWGTVADRRGSGLTMGLTPDTNPPPPDGLVMSHLRGTWDGADALATEASLHVRRGVSAITSSDDPDTGRDHPLALRRGTEADWLALCPRRP